jgi:hypothetical protein
MAIQAARRLQLRLQDFLNSALNHRPRHPGCTRHRHLATTSNRERFRCDHQSPYSLVRHTRKHLVTPPYGSLIHHSIRGLR